MKYLSLILSALLLIGGNVGSAMEDTSEPSSDTRSKSQIVKSRMKLKDNAKYFKENKDKIKDELRKQYNSEMNKDRIANLKEMYHNRPGGYLKTTEESKHDSECYGEFCNKTEKLNDLEDNYNITVEKKENHPVFDKIITKKDENGKVKGKKFVLKKNAKKLDNNKNITPSTSDSEKSYNELPIIRSRNKLKRRDLGKGMMMLRNDDMEEDIKDEEFDKKDKKNNIIKKIDIKKSLRRNGNTIGNKYMTNKTSIYDSEEYKIPPQFKTIDDIKTKEDLSKGGIFD